MKLITKRKLVGCVIFIEKSSLWTHWKALSVAFIAGVLITVVGLAWVYKSDLYKNGVEFQMSRSMPLNFGKKHEQERNSQSPDGATTTSD